MRLLLSGLCVAALGACSSSSLTANEEDILQRATAADAMLDELVELAPTSPTRMPTTGSAEFNGYAAVLIDPVIGLDEDDVYMLGEVTLTAEFAGTGAVTGTADEFDALVGSGDNARIEQVRGSLEIGSGFSEIGGGRPDNEWVANYGGILSIPDESYRISGTLNGGFLGNRTSAPEPETLIKGMFGDDDNLFSLDTDGDDAGGSFEVLASNPL